METVRTGVNLELAATSEILSLACELRPLQATLVPEKREEVTTEGGLDLTVDAHREANRDAIGRLQEAGVRTSLFIGPDRAAIETARDLGADAIELHTGEYANAQGQDRAVEVDRLTRASEVGREVGLAVHAGHGLTYENVVPVAAISAIEELNIGHSIVSRAVFVGLERAVREMADLIRGAPSLMERAGGWIPPIGF
jgi:pyridoxine 5-phosphate synthase